MEFPAEVFEAISADAIDLIRQLTRTVADERLSCEEALAHAWLREEVSS